MIETLLGGLFGGVLRLAPEAFKLFDRANERKHELALLNSEMEFAKVRGEIAMRQTEAQMLGDELHAIGKAFEEQSKTAISAGWFVAALSALVRPMITYLFVGAYFAVKFAMFQIAMDQNGDWKDVLINLWTKDDVTIMFMIISFWFVGRVWERSK